MELENAKKLGRAFTFETIFACVFVVVLLFGGAAGLSTTFDALALAATAAALIGLPSRNFGAITAAACLYAAATAYAGLFSAIFCLVMMGIMIGDAVAVSK